MGKKAEAGTPKAIANAMKAKGLQRLRWYCQVCQKQCRDENAFKQHSLSEGHVRQMLVVGENAGSYISDYSRQFQHDFIALLSRRWGTKRVQANRVYQEFIQDKSHMHMNATRWVTLTGFCQHLGKSGICHVDETEKGWFIAWIDNSPKALARQDATRKKERADMDDEERQRRLLIEQMDRAKAAERERRRAQQGDEEASTSSESGSRAASPEREEEEPVDIASMQPIKLSIGGSDIGKGKGREINPDDEPTIVPDVSVDISTAEQGDVRVNGALPTETVSAAVTTSAPGLSVTTVQSSTSTPNVSNGLSIAPPLAKPKVNPLKMMGSSKPNPLKSNPLKAGSSKASTSSDAASSSNNAKRPLTAVEAIVQEELEKKRRRENSTWSSGQGRGKEGIRQR